MADAKYGIGQDAQWLTANFSVLILGNLPPSEARLTWTECPLPHKAMCRLRESGLIERDDDGLWAPSDELIRAAVKMAESNGYHVDDLFADIPSE